MMHLKLQKTSAVTAYLEQYLEYQISAARARLFKTNDAVNVSLNFHKLISQIRQYFLLEKCEKLLHCKSFSFFQQKISVDLVIKL